MACSKWFPHCGLGFFFSVCKYSPMMKSWCKSLVLPRPAEGSASSQWGKGKRTWREPWNKHVDSACPVFLYTHLYLNTCVQSSSPFCVTKYLPSISKLTVVCKAFFKKAKESSKSRYSKEIYISYCTHILCSSSIIQIAVGKACMCEMRLTKTLQKPVFSDLSIYCLAPKSMRVVFFLLW